MTETRAGISKIESERDTTRNGLLQPSSAMDILRRDNAFLAARISQLEADKTRLRQQIHTATLKTTKARDCYCNASSRITNLVGDLPRRDKTIEDLSTVSTSGSRFLYLKRSVMTCLQFWALGDRIPKIGRSYRTMKPRISTARSALLREEHCNMKILFQMQGWNGNTILLPYWQQKSMEWNI